MTLSFLFWLIMVLWFIFGIVVHVPGAQTAPWMAWWPWGNPLLVFILLLLLGLRVIWAGRSSSGEGVP